MPEAGSTALKASSQSGSHGTGATSLKVARQSGSHGAGATSLKAAMPLGSRGAGTSAWSLPSQSGLHDDDQPDERLWESAEIANPQALLDRVHQEHWGWKTLWEQELAREAVGAVDGYVHGKWLHYLEQQVMNLDES